METKDSVIYKEMGMYTGISSLDEGLGCIRNNSLIFVAAYVGQCKTSLTINMAYKAIFQGFSVAFFTLEMTADELRNHVYAIHAANSIFADGEFSDVFGTITGEAIECGQLNSRQKEYLKFIKKDLVSEDYGILSIVQATRSGMSVGYVESKLEEIRSCNSVDIELVCIDHIGSLNYNTEPKEVTEGLKRLTFTSNGGAGTRILSPFHLSLESYQEASKNGGLYDISHVSDEYRVDRSSDVIISLFMDDEMRHYDKYGRPGLSFLQVCLLKNRRGASFKPFQLGIRLDTKVVYDIVKIDIEFKKMEYTEDDII